MSRRSPTIIDNEIAAITCLVDTLQQREDEACRLRDALRADKQALLERCVELEAEKWPINWLPNELLIHIFIELSESMDFGFNADELFHRPPVVLSHVCRRWREICLTTSRLWSRIACSSRRLCRTALLTFIERSANNPLDLTLKSPPQSGGSDFAASYVLAKLRPHVYRLQSLFFQCQGALAMEEIVDMINVPTCDLSCLRSLTLQITEDNPSFLKTPSIRGFNNSRRGGQGNSVDYSPIYNSSLQELRLKQVPLFVVPSHLLTSILFLELSFTPKDASAVSQYVLRMSDLRRFLCLMPQLTELVLFDTIPFFDVLLNPEFDSDSAIFEPGEILCTSSRTRSVELPFLRSLEWTYPYPSDVHRFIAFLFAPSLEILDLCLDDMSLNRPNTALIRGYDDANATRDDTIVPRVIQLGSLKELSVQCVDEDALTLVFRRFLFPVLEKLAIANVDARRRNDGTLAPVPRLESIFRDPRMPYLTHLTLSHFDVNPENGRSMLGYMPALTFLSLDTCFGVWKILEALTEMCGGPEGIPPDHTMARRLIARFCPRLSSLSLLRCTVEAEGLRTVVKARNVRARIDSVAEDKQDGVILVPYNRPIKKLPRPAANTYVPGVNSTIRSSLAGGRAASTASSAEDVCHAARIVCIRVGDCGSITKEETLSLRDLGVEDVVWSDAT